MDIKRSSLKKAFAVAAIGTALVTAGVLYNQYRPSTPPASLDPTPTMTKDAAGAMAATKLDNTMRVARQSNGIARSPEYTRLQALANAVDRGREYKRFVDTMDRHWIGTKPLTGQVHNQSNVGGTLAGMAGNPGLQVNVMSNMEGVIRGFAESVTSAPRYRSVASSHPEAVAFLQSIDSQITAPLMAAEGKKMGTPAEVRAQYQNNSATSGIVPLLRQDNGEPSTAYRILAAFGQEYSVQNGNGLILNGLTATERHGMQIVHPSRVKAVGCQYVFGLDAGMERLRDEKAGNRKEYDRILASVQERLPGIRVEQELAKASSTVKSVGNRLGAQVAEVCAVP